MVAFNPRHIPICAHSTAAIHQQTAIAPDALSLTALRWRFGQPFFQCNLWQPKRLHESSNTQQPLRLASVLIALQNCPNTQQLQVLLTQRSLQLPVYAGQIAFPGGKADDTDCNAIHTALREAQEEVGIQADAVQVLGCLPSYATGTGFLITPVVAALAPNAHAIINSSEVDDVFYVPLPFLMNPKNYQQHQHHDANGVLQQWYATAYVDKNSQKERFIWGVTAAIVRDFYQFLALDIPAV